MNLDDIPVGEGRVVVVAGAEVAVFRLRNGEVRALDAVCPHLGGPLADGLIDNRVVICPLHNRSYDLDTGAELTLDGPPVACYPVSVDEHGELTVGR